MEIKSKSWEYLKKELVKNFPKFVSSSGLYSLETEFEIRDLDWNHMDGFHRPSIHKTYLESIRVASDKNIQFSLTRFGLTPLILPVCDIRLGQGEFYQVVSILNLFTIISFIKLEKQDDIKVKQIIEWEIFSHSWLGFFHKFINKKIYKLNKIQNQEDHIIRQRRSKLRKLGFSFETDNPNYLNSNDLNCKLIPPKNNHKGDLTLEFSNFPVGEIHKINIDEISLFIKRNKKNLQIWPGICPHEGAELTSECFIGDTLTCPWHNLKYKPHKLNLKNSELSLLGLKFKYFDGFIKITC